MRAGRSRHVTAAPGAGRPRHGGSRAAGRPDRACARAPRCVSAAAEANGERNGAERSGTERRVLRGSWGRRPPAPRASCWRCCCGSAERGLRVRNGPSLPPARHGGGEAAGGTRRVPGPGEQPELVLPLPQHPGCCWGPSGACSESGGREKEMGLSAGGNNELSRRVLCDLGAKRWNIRLCYKNGGCWSDP